MEFIRRRERFWFSPLFLKVGFNSLAAPGLVVPSKMLNSFVETQRRMQAGASGKGQAREREDKKKETGFALVSLASSRS